MGILQLVVRLPYYHHTTIISISKSRPQMPELPIVRDPLHTMLSLDILQSDKDMYEIKKENFVN